MLHSYHAESTVSVYHAGGLEAARHRWIESEKRGYDLGCAAEYEWYCQHWLTFCRYRRYEHLLGHCRFAEFGDGFGELGRLLRENDLLLERILDRMLSGWENLDLIVWARDWGLPMEQVIGHLTLIDINRARLPTVPEQAG